MGGVGAHQHLFLGFVPRQCLEIRRGRLYVKTCFLNFCSYSLHHDSTFFIHIIEIISSSLTFIG